MRLRREKEVADRQQEAQASEVEQLRQQVTDQGRRIETEQREKNSLMRQIRGLNQEKEATDRQKVAKSLEVEDLRLQVTDLQLDLAQLNDSLSLKEQTHQAQLQEHQATLDAKDQDPPRLQLRTRDTKPSYRQNIEPTSSSYKNSELCCRLKSRSMNFTYKRRMQLSR